MDDELKKAIYNAVKNEPFARCLNMSLAALEEGYARIEMVYDPSQMNNIYQRAHGGAIFSLIDEAFETASQTRGAYCSGVKRQCHLYGIARGRIPVDS